MKKQVTKDQIKKISVLINQQGLTELKDSLVWQFTSGRETSRTKMYVDEAASLIQSLVKDDPSTKMRNKIFAICHNMGWLYKGMHDVNRMVIDRFLEKRGAVKKPLAKMDKAELVQVVSQFELIQSKAELRKFGETVLAEVLKELNIDRSTGRPLQN